MAASELAYELFQLRNPKHKIHYGEWDTEKHCPMWIPSGKPIRTHAIDLRPIPEPDVDGAACMELLEYVLRQSVDGEIFEIHDMYQGPDAWYVGIGMSFPSGNERYGSEGESVIFPTAIAIACRGALKAIAKAKT